MYFIELLHCLFFFLKFIKYIFTFNDSMYVFFLAKSQHNENASGTQMYRFRVISIDIGHCQERSGKFDILK